jgi:hypothetical protein
LRTSDNGWLRGEVVAVITLVAYLLPAGLGDTSLATGPALYYSFRLRNRHDTLSYVNGTHAVSPGQKRDDAAMDATLHPIPATVGDGQRFPANFQFRARN